MSIGSGNSFFKVYAKNSYMNKMNPQFQGIAKKYYDQKREHTKVHTMKEKLGKDIAYLQRIEKNATKTLKNKKRQLQYTKEKNNRILSEVKRREWLQELQKADLRANYEKAQIKKIESQRKLKEAKMFMSQHKRSLADLNRMENQKIKQAKTIKRAQQWDLNRSRVSSINQFTKNVKIHTNKFYQTRTSVSLSKYEQRIKSYKKFGQYDVEKMKKLENMKLSLQSKYQKELSQSEEVSKQIEKIRKEAKLQNSLLRSRLRSNSSSSSVRSGKQLKNLKHKSQNFSGVH